MLKAIRNDGEILNVFEVPNNLDDNKILALKNKNAKEVTSICQIIIKKKTKEAVSGAILWNSEYLYKTYGKTVETMTKKTYKKKNKDVELIHVLIAKIS